MDEAHILVWWSKSSCALESISSAPHVVFDSFWAEGSWLQTEKEKATGAIGVIWCMRVIVSRRKLGSWEVSWISCDKQHLEQGHLCDCVCLFCVAGCWCLCVWLNWDFFWPYQIKAGDPNIFLPILLFLRMVIHEGKTKLIDSCWLRQWAIFTPQLSPPCLGCWPRWRCERTPFWWFYPWHYK